jgi:GIY-YIG catalytic domain
VSHPDVLDLIEALTAGICTLGEARRKPGDGGIPPEPGLYSWWITEQDALPGVPANLFPGHSLYLLYVGIAPKDDRSRQRLRSWVCSNHMTGNIGSSTFRLSLAALLWRSLAWTPVWRGDRPQLSRDDNRALSIWQTEHLRIGWVVRPEPWRYESAVIAGLQPPMNLAENAGHPFHKTMSDARRRLRAGARVTE